MPTVKRVTVTKDSVSAVVGAIHALVRKQVLVGIPDSSTERTDEGPITNATLGYIHEFGSPKANIPARPFLIPGVEKALDKGMDQLERAAVETLRGDPKAADRRLHQAGIIAMSSARREIHYGEFEPLKPATVRNRRYGRGTQGMRDAEGIYLYLVARGVHPADAQREAGIRPLINTAQLANAITYVVREK